MRALFKLILLLILLSPLAVAALAWFALADRPLVTDSVTLSHQDIARAKAILKANDPRHLPPGSRRTIEIGASDLNLAGSYLIKQLFGGSSRIALDDNRLNLKVSAAVPMLPLRNTINLDTTIRADQGRATIASFTVGQVPVPGPMATLIARYLIGKFYVRAQIDTAAELVRDLHLYPDRLQLTYQWNPALIEQARDTLLTDGDRDALRFYHDLLAGLQAQNIGRRGSLVDLLAPIFSAALERSKRRDPVVENTALLTVLGTWASHQDLSGLVPGQLSRPGRFRLKLQRRGDFAQHFLTSAALAARGDGALSDAVGLFKEIADTDHGSGFSFTDIAADRAGTRFGELATRSAESAHTLQRRLAAGVAETDLMPPARDLPEHMDAATFRQRFDHVGSPAYLAMMDLIEQRIDACSLYRN